MNCANGIGPCAAICSRSWRSKRSECARSSAEGSGSREAIGLAGSEKRGKHSGCGERRIPHCSVRERTLCAMLSVTWRRAIAHRCAPAATAFRSEILLQAEVQAAARAELRGAHADAGAVAQLVGAV